MSRIYLFPLCFSGPNETKLCTALGQIKNTDSETFPSSCAKWLVAWIRDNSENSWTELQDLLTNLDEEIIKRNNIIFLCKVSYIAVYFY